VVAHACNLRSFRSRDQEYIGLRPSQANSYQDPISTKKLVIVVHTYDPNSTSGHKEGDLSLRLAQAKTQDLRRQDGG
jgi:hypothetical protein